jgi:RecG-like helicase
MINWFVTGRVDAQLIQLRGRVKSGEYQAICAIGRKIGSMSSYERLTSVAKTDRKGVGNLDK